MVLLIDNYDSFTYNIYQYLRQLGHDVQVRRNNAVSTAEITESLKPDQIILSPGPGGPESAGICLEIIRSLQGRIPILGVCLGHQCIGAAFGAEIVPAADICHGRESLVYHDGNGVFRGLKNPFRAIRYHSLAIDRGSLSTEMEVTAWTEDDEIMGVRHKTYSVEGVQFHPESIGTEQGLEILANFVESRPRPSRIQEALARVCGRMDLECGEAEEVMAEIADGKATTAQIAGLLTAMHLKGESVSEITGFARAMRRRVIPVNGPENTPLLDTCGTGGDGKGTFNISTCAAFVAAGAGARVAKHGNRSITSRCGSADVLEALGVNITAPTEVMEKCLREIGLAFLFAPRLHPAMKNAVPARLEIGVKSIFNILGPLVNPAAASRQLIGVNRAAQMDRMAAAVVRLGTERTMLVQGQDGLDEISLCGATQVVEIRDHWTCSYAIRPQDLGLAPCRPEELHGGNLKTNAEIVLAVLDGRKGPHRDAVLLNAAAAIYLYDLVPDLNSGVRAAAAAIDGGAARNKLEDLVRCSNA
ncbi:MAG TPA: bifunctional anthranilate synthase component II/anthranilate phosphoribosyltransferase [Candidatus Aminicenantes bacterium]|nr:bifunctional anthranilate synthase component II/anthranilate phosphoribosyltransferase [Candidatus Aminicenantes bacterium]